MTVKKNHNNSISVSMLCVPVSVLISVSAIQGSSRPTRAYTGVEERVGPQGPYAPRGAGAGGGGQGGQLPPNFLSQGDGYACAPP